MTTVPPIPSDQQPYPAPVAPTAPAGAGSHTAWLWTAGVAAAVGLVAVVTSSGGTAASTPLEAVQAHVDAYVDEDWTAAYEYLCAEEQERYGDAASYAERTSYEYGGALRSVTIGEARKVGHDIDVDLVLHTVLGDGDAIIDVVEENGSFRVCDDLLG